MTTRRTTPGGGALAAVVHWLAVLPRPCSARRPIARPVGVVAALVTAVLVGAACVPAPAAVAHDGAKVAPPVLVIGGFELSCQQDPSDWDPWKAAIDADRPKAEVASFTFDPCRPIELAANELGLRVTALLERTGAPAVQIVAHSQGNLVARWCIRFGTCAGRVDTLLGLAPANHGTIWANLCPIVGWATPGCSSMTPEGPVVSALNSEDETWGSTRYVTASSWCDLAIVPSLSGTLDGAENVTLSRCVGHTEWKTDPAAIRWGVEILAGRPVAPLT